MAEEVLERWRNAAVEQGKKYEIHGDPELHDDEESGSNNADLGLITLPCLQGVTCLERFSPLQMRAHLIQTNAYGWRNEKKAGNEEG